MKNRPIKGRNNSLNNETPGDRESFPILCGPDWPPGVSFRLSVIDRLCGR